MMIYANSSNPQVVAAGYRDVLCSYLLKKSMAKYKILISVFMILFSLAAAVIGFAIVGASNYTYPVRFAFADA